MKYCKIVAGDEFLYIKFKMQNGKKGKGLATPEQAKKMIFDLEAALSQRNQPRDKSTHETLAQLSKSVIKLADLVTSIIETQNKIIDNMERIVDFNNPSK